MEEPFWAVCLEDKDFEEPEPREEDTADNDDVVADGVDDVAVDVADDGSAEDVPSKEDLYSGRDEVFE